MIHPHEISRGRRRRPPPPRTVARTAFVAAAALVWLATASNCKKEPSRWDSAEQAPLPAKRIEPARPEQAGSSFNKAFPPDGVDGYKRVFTQEKEGFAEAKLQQEGKDVAALAISDVANDPEAKAKFAKATDTVAGLPLVTVGKNQSAALVKDRFQIKVSSTTLDPETRKQLLAKFDVEALNSL
jgi:hypothetical protein